MFAALSSGHLNKEHIGFVGALGPVIVASHVKDVTWRILSRSSVIWAGRALDKKDIQVPALLKPAADIVCALKPHLCEDIMKVFIGSHMHLNQSRLPVLIAHEPGGTSTLNLAHWAQLVRTGQFGYYDYGWDDNPHHYNGSHVAPLYNISNYPSSSVPTAIISGADDELADPADVRILVDSLPYSKDTLVQVVPDYGHLDFLWDPAANSRVYQPTLIPFMQKHFPPLNMTHTETV